MYCHFRAHATAIILFVGVAGVFAVIATGGQAGATASQPHFTTNAAGRVWRAGPDSYLSIIKNLGPGDVLVLAPAVYDVRDQVPGLPIFNLHGTAGRPIVITGPIGGPRPILVARPTHNTVRIANASHVTIANLELDGRRLAVDGVKAQGISHHITIENLLIRNHDSDQQTVGISTKAPAWNWVVRGNVIEGAGTGMYFGSSDGTAPFVAGLIEHNLVVDTLGYSLQIKHQVERPVDIGMPTGASITVIRHNVFSKQRRASAGSMARPNALVGHFPLRGVGADDRYAIYANFFYENSSSECLFQGEGNLALYSNVFVNRQGDAICIQPHHDVPRAVDVFRNTVLAQGIGVRVLRGHSGYRQVAIGNAIFTAEPIRGARAWANVTASLQAASAYLTRPQSVPGALDLSPLPQKLVGTPFAVHEFPALPDAHRDFDGHVFDDRARGAYRSTPGPRWPLALSIKPVFKPSTDARR